MVVVAVVTTAISPAAPDSVPRRLFEDLPDVEIEVERFVPVGDSAVPYFWVRGAGLDDFERTVEAYPEVSTVERLETTATGDLYRLDWAVDSPLIQCIDRAGARLVEAHGTAERWELTLWFEQGADASVLLECCRTRDVPITVESLQSVGDLDGGGVVTDPQREALLEAYHRGYFEQPRAVSQRELAERLDISAAALGVRLRRGTANLVTSYVVR